MTMFAVTQTNRFRAAVAGAGLSDWQSYYGQNSIDQWMIPFFGASVYDDPAVYAKSSAITFIKKAKTPMLIIVGDRDGECPAPQSFEMWHALKDLGVKTQLVVYPDEGHGFRNPEHIRDRNERNDQVVRRQHAGHHRNPDRAEVSTRLTKTLRGGASAPPSSLPYSLFTFHYSLRPGHEPLITNAFSASLFAQSSSNTYTGGSEIQRSCGCPNDRSA